MGVQPSGNFGFFQDEKVHECANDLVRSIHQLAEDFQKLIKDKKGYDNRSLIKNLAEEIHKLEQTIEYAYYLYKHPENPLQAENAEQLKKKLDKEFSPHFEGSRKFDTISPPQTLFSATARFNNGHEKHLLEIFKNMSNEHFKAHAWVGEWEKFNPFAKF